MASTSTSSSTSELRATGVRSDDDSAFPVPLLNTRICRYFSQSGKCREGNNCPFLHDDTRLPGGVHDPTADSKAGGMANPSRSVIFVGEEGMVQDRRQAMSQVPQSRVVTKPVPKGETQNPREFQLGQIRRRFSPKETSQGSGTLLKFSLVPSDPDFPFEISALECLLSVPTTYPKEPPSLRVGNKDIPRGFAFNIEAGFESLVESTDSTLLELLKSLDKNLETFLSAPKADTVKLVPNKDTRHLSLLPNRSVEPTVPTVKVDEQFSDLSFQKSVKPSLTSSVSYTAAEKSVAAKRREAETRQVEARMGRLPLYKKSGDGIAYTIPIEPRRRAELPVALQAVKSVQLFVPLLYSLQPCRIQLEGVDSEVSKPVEIGFERKAIESKETTLMGHINHLVQNIHLLAKTVVESKPVPSTPSKTEASLDAAESKQTEGHQDEERSHIQYIPRPPEWTIISAEDVSDHDSSDDYSYDSGDESSDDGGVGVKSDDNQQPPQLPAQNPERGTAISFPFIELYGIELLEIVLLNIAVKCERCKDITEVKGLRTGITKTESCKKCASPLSICYRRDLIHAHAVRAGFLDLEGCFVSDMLPSTFLPTCSQCSTPYPNPGIVSVQGESTSNVCRECHQKFSFKLPQVKFLRISTSERLPLASGPRRKKETLGLTPGTELPKRGRCRHYTKSYRWFRFSCCMKVYACDKCHDEGEIHPNEWANRMICGWCSREGNYRPEDCGFCHGVLVGKKSAGGFWEGGKGTRDKVKMSRKDKRKFRRPGAAVRKT